MNLEKQFLLGYSCVSFLNEIADVLPVPGQKFHVVGN